MSNPVAKQSITALELIPGMLIQTAGGFWVLVESVQLVDTHVIANFYWDAIPHRFGASDWIIQVTDRFAVSASHSTHGFKGVI